MNSSLISHLPRLNIRQKTIDQISLNALLRRFGSPLYVVSHRALVNTYKDFSTVSRRFYPNSQVAYSVKTNNVPGICRLLKNQGVLAEVVSSYEYWLAKKLGFEDREIIFNGPNKGEMAMQSALFSGSKIHLDNQDELNRLTSYTRGRKKKVNIGIRVNPFVENHSRFGFCISSGEATQAIKTIRKFRDLQLSGIHFHIGSNVFPPDLYREATETVCRFILKNKNFLPNLQYLDVGGGYPVPGSGAFDDTDKIYSIEDYLRCIVEPIMRYRLDKLQLILEPGRYLVDEPIVLIATVISNRARKNENNVTVDASLNILPLAQSRRQRIALIRNVPPSSSFLKPTKRQTTIHGSSCVEKDWLAKAVFPPISVGDYIIFYNAGAYNLSQAGQFSSPRPGVVLIKDHQLKVLRSREKFQDLVLKDKLFR